MAKRTISIIAGPNGSGKSTFAQSFTLQNRIGSFLNPDLIAAGIDPIDYESASFQAGRILISQIKDRISKGESFAFESTLSGRTWVSLLREAKVSQGYEIEIFFIFLNDVQKNLARIKKRVRMGGHHISDEAVFRRQPRVFDNFWNLYRPLCERWFLFDNSGVRPRLLLSKDGFNELSDSEKKLVESNFVKGHKVGKTKR